jgi:hypothetical protein
MQSNLLRTNNTAEKEIMANVSKLIFGVAIVAPSIATPALAVITVSQFLLIRMSHEAAKEAAFTISLRCRRPIIEQGGRMREWRLTNSPIAVGCAWRA